MKKLEMIIRPENLQDLKQAMDKMGIKGMTVSTVMGYGKQRGIKEIYRGAELTVNLLHKVKVEMVVADAEVEEIIKKVKETVSTGNVGDGKIFVFNVENAIRIRTGESGETAIG